MTQDQAANSDASSGNSETQNADAWTIKRLLEWTTEYFGNNNSDSPRLEAEILLAEAMGCQRIELYTRFDQVPPADQIQEFRGWVKRHAAGEPVAYLVGHREFYSLRFAVNSNVLIPRPETEHVVVSALECAKKMDVETPRIVDVGTGSGCIVVTLAKHLQSASFVATDISEDALTVAKQNAQSNGVEALIEFQCGNLLEPVGDEPVHIIVSNPPYIGTAEEGAVAADVRMYEPAVALFSGEDGTEATLELISQSAHKLVPGGFLIFETSPFIFDKCCEMVEADGAFSVVDRIKDLGGHHRVVVAQKSA